MDDVILTLDGTLSASINDNLKSFVRINKNTKFMIFSDYCLDDKNKPNKVASFTIIPYDFEFIDYSTYLGEIAPSDIKNCRTINSNFIQHIAEERLFSVSFIFENLKGLTQNSTISGKDFVNPRIDNTISMIKKWIANQPNQRKYYKSIIKKLMLLKVNINRKSPNLNLYRNVVIIPLLAGYLAYLLTKEANAEIVGWFSDRDKITEVWDGLALDSFALNHNALCEHNGLESSTTKIVLGTDGGSREKLWFDNLNRIPDHLAGTLSSWDINNNIIQRGKHIDILRHCFADNDFCSIVNVAINPTNYKFHRITVSKEPPNT